MTNQNISTDGVNFNETTETLIYGSYYFLHDRMNVHSRNVYNILTLSVNFGSIFALVARLGSLIGLFINTRVHAANMLNEMFFLKLSKHKPSKGMWKNLNKLTTNLHELTFS